MKHALLTIMPELLTERLFLPEGATIVGAMWDVRTRTVVFDVEHGELHEVIPGHEAERIRVISRWA